MPSDHNIPRVGLIGVSGYGSIYLQLALEFQRRDELRLVSAVVINPQEAAPAVEALRHLRCEIFNDYPSMLEKHRGALELCLIPTGISWHTRMTLAALGAGAHVLVEKPLASSIAEVRAVETEAARANRFVAVGFQDFYDPATHWVKEQLVGGAIGRIQSVRFLGMWPRPRSYFTRNNWAGRLRVDGVPVFDSPLNNAFGHFVNLALFFAGAREQESAVARIESAEVFRAHKIESFDTAVLQLRTEDDVPIWLGATHACDDVHEPEIIVTGTTGRVHWWHEREVRIYPDGAEPRCHKVADPANARRSMMQAVLRRLRDPSVEVCGPDIAIRHTSVIEAVAGVAETIAFPERIVEWVSKNGQASAVPVVDGFKAAMIHAFTEGSTLKAAGFSVDGASRAASS